MARGDFVDAGKSKLANRDAYSGFWWRYANTSQEAINTNSDIIEIYPYIWKSNSITDAYTNNLYNSYIQVSFGSTTYNQTLKTKYNFGNVSLNTNYGLTSAFNSSNPFGYSAPSSTTYITTTTKDGKTLYGARFTVQHNADGTSPSVTMKWHLEASSTHGNAEKTITVTLDTIPRASQPTCAGTTLGNSVTIYTNRPAGSGFTHTLNIKIGSTTIETFTGITDSKSWTPSIATYLSYIPSSSGTATIECITYSSGSEIGRATTSCVLTVPNNSDTKPTLTLTVSKGDNVVPDAWGVYVKGKSKLAISIVGSPKAGTSITSYYSTANGSSDTRSSYTTSELTGSGTVTANVKDGRGFTSNNATASYTVQDYTNPQITTSSVARCTSDGTLSDEGTYVKYSFAGSISPVSNKNAKTFKLRYKEKNGSYSDVATWSSAYTLNQTDIVFGSGNIDITKEYVFRFEATDSFTTTAKEVEIGTVADLMNFNSSGKSMAIGGVSQRGANDKYLDIYIDTEIKKSGEPIKIINNTPSTDTFYSAQRTDTNQTIRFGIGAGGENRGIYDTRLNKWIVYCNNSNAYLNGTAQNVSNNVDITGKFKTKRSFKFELDAENSQGRYYKLISIPATANGNACVVNIKGEIGNWTTGKATIDLQISNRENLTVYGTIYGNQSGALDSQAIVIYKETDNSHTVYLKNITGYTGPNILDISYSGFSNLIPTIYTEYSYTTTPTGTLAYSSSTTKPTIIPNGSTLTRTSDFEEGNNTNGNYIKFPNGTMICYRTVNISGTTTTWGSMYYIWNTTQFNFAQSFISKPVVNLSIEPTNSNGCWIASPNQPTITKDYVKGLGVARPTSASVNVNVHIIAIGKWK